jgi:hypothetical protein
MFDAQAWLQRRVARRWQAGLLIFAVTLPALSGFVGRIAKSDTWFADYGAVACAARMSEAGRSLYEAAPDCPDMRVMPFVYLPQVAQLWAGFTDLIGEPGARLAFISLHYMALATLVWFACLRRDRPGPRIERAPFAVLITGSALTWGNFAVPLHALVALTAEQAARRPWLFLGPVLLAGWLKPLYLTFLVVFLLAPISLARRAVWFSLGVAAGVAPFAAFLLTPSPAREQWYALVQHYVFVEAPGEGLFGWVAVVGGSPAEPAVWALYLLFAALLTVSAIALAEGAQVSATDRAMLGLAVGTLLLPRPLPHDLFLLGPGMAVAVSAAGALGDPARRAAALAVYGACALALLLNLVDLSDYAPKAATLVFAATLLGLGAAFARPAVANLRARPA